MENKVWWEILLRLPSKASMLMKFCNSLRQSLKSLARFRKTWKLKRLISRFSSSHSSSDNTQYCREKIMLLSLRVVKKAKNKKITKTKKRKTEKNSNAAVKEISSSCASKCWLWHKKSLLKVLKYQLSLDKFHFKPQDNSSRKKLKSILLHPRIKT